jgi:hypothetical protein
MRFNKYVRNGSVQRFNDGEFSGVMLFGKALYDPRDPWSPRHLLGRPEELVFTVAGRTYYPTPEGYEQV